ncbi:O-antigen translocase [Butyricimonas sp. Marseille-P3923]|uniref:O-antigen translocase n=1 Tax=Butyricimonas sp. Marseille-P3923 TaxID=1987504 RepID=UPI00159B8C31|nr:O-antigen translocase [Butyricimonas sp. Marseille-P3923]
MNNNSKEGYKSAFKATSLFGGVQVITILIGIVRSKFVAVWLGPLGLGILSVFSTAVQMIYSISNLGLSNSAVREISLNNNPEGSNYNLSVIIASLRKWVIYTAGIGGVLTIFLSPVLSGLFFNSNDHIFSFIFLSIAVFFTCLFNWHYAILQGVRHLKAMAKARVQGAFCALIFTLPLYYYLRENGVVLALIVTTLISFVISRYYTQRIQIKKIGVPLKEAYRRGLPTVKLGIMMAISAIAVTLVEFCVKSFITSFSGIHDVGLYQAGWAINVSYLGMVFTAMSTDYYPRLSQVACVPDEFCKRVNEQAEIALLILGPMIMIMFVFLSYIVSILYTKEFDSIIPMVKWLLIGSLIKGGAWSLGFTFLAKGDGRAFLFNELGIKFITLPAYLLGYYYWGLIGIGYAYAFNYLIYFFLVGYMSYKKYLLQLKKSFWFFLLFYLLCILCYYIIDGYVINSLLIKFVFILVIVGYSLYEIHNRVGLNIWRK